jgi:hypothetical protein
VSTTDANVLEDGSRSTSRNSIQLAGALRILAERCADIYHRLRFRNDPVQVLTSKLADMRLSANLSRKSLTESPVVLGATCKLNKKAREKFQQISITRESLKEHYEFFDKVLSRI